MGTMVAEELRAPQNSIANSPKGLSTIAGVPESISASRMMQDYIMIQLQLL